MIRVLTVAAVIVVCASAQTAPAPTVSKVFDSQLSSIEREWVSLAEAMPAEKYGFVPKDGEFSGVRTFAQQVSHTAAVLYAVASASLKEKNPSEMGTGENGPANLKTKGALVKYLKEAFAYGHKAMQSLTAENLVEMVESPFGTRQTPRGGVANVAVWHSFDHYGQAAIYARMNGIVPPASRR